MQYFKGIPITYELYAGDGVSLWSSIDKYFNEGSRIKVVDKPSIYNADNRSKYNHIFLPFVTYSILSQTYGGPDQNILFLQIWFSGLALFLLGNMNWLVMIWGCLQLSLFNGYERAIVIINTVLVDIYLHLTTNLLKWYAYIICKSKYLAQTRYEVDEYYKQCNVALVIMECLQKIKYVTLEETTTDASKIY